MEAEENREEIEVYNTISVQNEENDAEDNIYPNTSIKIDKDQYSIFELKRKYDKGKICMDPSFQRNFVWKSRQMSELIESVIMGIPLPLIYLAESENGEKIEECSEVEIIKINGVKAIVKKVSTINNLTDSNSEVSTISKN